jgi:predicted NBD/HSP70 family sugar kinase
MGSVVKTVGANAERARSHNRQMVLDRVRQAGQVGRAEIARATGLSTQAVSNIIANLLSDGLIVEGGRRAAARGQPPVQYGLNPDGGYAVGIEIRPDAIFTAVLNLSGQVVATSRDALAANDINGVTCAVRNAKLAILNDLGIPDTKLLGAGLVMPGPFGRTGLSGTSSMLSIFDDISVNDWFSEALGVGVVVENDANASAVAERVSGVAKGFDSFAYLYFGSGLGLGIVENGRLIGGALGNAGEIGHIPVLADGQKVSLESKLSRLSVQAHLSKAGLETTSTDDLLRLFSDENRHLLGWLNQALEPFSNAITIIENILDPETIVLGGAMPDPVFDYLIENAVLAELSVSVREDRIYPRLLPGTSGRMTGTLGAAALVLNRTFTPRISATA